MMRKAYYFILLAVFLFSISCKQGEGSGESVNDGQDTIVADIEALSKRLERDTANAGLYQQRALLYLQQRNPNQAMRDMLMAIQLSPDNPAYLLTLSDIYMSMGLADNCAEALDKVLEIDPENTEAMLKLAEIYLLLENYREAIANADKAIAIDKSDPLPHFIKGWTYAEAGDTINAIKSYLEAIDRKQDYYDAYIQLGLIYSTAHNELAIDYFNNALNIDPQSVEALYALGMFYQEAGDAEKAMTYYNQLLTLDPSNVYATYNLGYIYLVYIGDFEKAIDQFNQALILKPDYFEALYNKGYCLELLGEYAAARDAYSEVLEMETNYQKAIDGLNRIYGL